jgi:phospholipid/cholesterol/gamma-HCH transport system substrate-binding protein
MQLIAFVVLAALGVSYAGAKYAGLGRLLGPTTYTVELELADSGGIFRNAEVTYQGVSVGRVGELTPTESGVSVELNIDKDAVPIPAEGLQADVKNLSAIGELYVDLTAPIGSASSDGGDGDDETRFLDDGSIIRVDQTSTPVAPAVLLESLDGLLTSVPQRSLQTVLRELDAAFSETGPDLERLLDTFSTLVASANDALPETLALIRDGETVLRTQNDRADSIRSFSRSLRLLAQQLEDSDPDLRRLIETGPAISTQVSALLRESGPGLSRLVADLLTTGRLLEPRNQALRQLLITYPALARAAYSAVPGDGTVKFGLVVNAFDPLPCTRGYEGTNRRTGSQLKDIPVNAEATCAEPRGSAINVRGSQNAPSNPIPGAVAAPTRADAAAARRTPVAGDAALLSAVTPQMLARLADLLEQQVPALVSDPVDILVRSSPLGPDLGRQGSAR